MRHVGRHQDEVRCLILPDVIADKPPTAAIQSQRELVFRMVVPFERYFRNAAIIDAKRTALRKGDALELRLHQGTYSDINPLLVVRIISIVGASASFKSLRKS
jgi:hypothetical protein